MPPHLGTALIRIHVYASIFSFLQPGVVEQMTKLEMLIAELKEQESSHLGVLLSVMV